MGKHLYIIGNGFDLHHKIKSSYGDFRDWLKSTHQSVMWDLDEIYGSCGVEWWGDFENNLADLDVFQYASAIADENTPDLMSDHCDRTWGDAQAEVEYNLGGLYSDLRKFLRKWVRQLNKPSEECQIRLEIQNSRFINFNYTYTLEDMYKVPDNQILHIHGCISDGTPLVIGHGKDPEDLRAMNEVDDPPRPSSDIPESYEEWTCEMEQRHPLHEQMAEDAAIDAVASQRKPVGDIMQNNIEFFNALNDVTNIHVYGFSFSDVDMPYLDKITEIAKGAKWEISDYQDKCKTKIEAFVTRNQIDHYEIIDLKSLYISNQTQRQ